jgi:hypothetical protein
MAKSWSVFRDELERFDDPFQRIADLLFNVVKVGDVAMGDLVNHLGEVLAPAKAVGLSFENLLTLIAKMSRTAGTEQISSPAAPPARTLKMSRTPRRSSRRAASTRSRCPTPSAAPSPRRSVRSSRRG